MPKVHWVYPSGPQIRTPFAIGRKVAEALRARGHEVVQWDWDDDRVIDPEPGDVLVGHAHFLPRTIFRRSARRKGWRRVIAVQPYSHGRPDQLAFLDPVMGDVDQFLAITGSYWFSRVAEAPFAHWRPKMVHVDLALDRRDYPRTKGAFAPPGKRRFVYIGGFIPAKNVPYLSAIARRCGATFGWIGSHVRQPGLETLGFADFATEEGRALATRFDFMITVGDSDANPTTLLEAASWGLVPVCTPQSGYEAEPGFVNVPLGDVEGAAHVIDELQHCPNERLEDLRAENERRLDTHFTWARFSRQLTEAIASDASPALLPVTPRQQLGLWWARMTAPISSLRPRHHRALRRANYARRKAAWRAAQAAAGR